MSRASVTRRGVLGAAGALGLGLLAGCRSAPRTLYFRLTVEVDTPEGLRTGSGVQAIIVEDYDGFLDKALAGLRNFTGLGAYFIGDAIPVDLGDRGWLFVLIVGDAKRSSADAFNALWKAHPEFHGPQGLDAGNMDRLARLRGATEIAPTRLPLMVRFRDIADPDTIERVDPEDLAASFGEGVHLRRAFVEVTDGPVTRGLEKLLPWLLTAEWLRLKNYDNSSISITEFIDENHIFRSLRKK